MTIDVTSGVEERKQDLDLSYPPIIGVDVAGATFNDSSAITVIDLNYNNAKAVENAFKDTDLNKEPVTKIAQISKPSSIESSVDRFETTIEMLDDGIKIISKKYDPIYTRDGDAHIAKIFRTEIAVSKDQLNAIYDKYIEKPPTLTQKFKNWIQKIKNKFSKKEIAKED